MKKAWLGFALAVLAVSCGGGPEEPQVGSRSDAISYCRTASLYASVTSSGSTPGVWTGSMLGQPPGYVTVSSNMPVYDSGPPTTHYLTFGATRADGSFRVDVTCRYQGKQLVSGSYRSWLKDCTPENPKRMYSFTQARLETWTQTIPATGTWSAMADVNEVFDDENPCTQDVCNLPFGGATHTYTPTNPGCGNPNPLTGAPPGDKSLASNVADDAAALFALQGGTPGALDARRASVVRGFVYQTEPTTGQAQVAPGVAVSVLEHPELGAATSDNSGAYALAVNGGGSLTLNYQKATTLGAQRQVELRWHEFRKVQDVQLVSHNTGAATSIDMSVPGLHVARGIVQSDTRGTRQATILIPSGTTSNDIPGSTWTFNITEFTVGPDGQRRMPGSLPDASGYTYAFAADISQASGAHVTFNQPLVFYVQDFPNFKVGKMAPLGWYDDSAGLWRAESSGVVLHFLSTDPSTGKANIDTDGDGFADSAGVLAAFGITDEERLALPNQFASNTKLIRVQLPHLSKWDINWNIAPPAGAGGPNAPGPSGGPPDCTSPVVGSIIECESRALAEELPITGTPFTLRYQSDRTPGYHIPIKIPLSGSSWGAVTPPKRVDWKVNIAGREFSGQGSNALNQYVTLNWDGLDGFGRTVQGRTPMEVQIGNVYDGKYADTSEFGYSGMGEAIAGNPDTGELTFWKADQIMVGAYDAAGFGFGGWSLSHLHALELEAGDIYLGSGRTRTFDKSYRMAWVGGDPALSETDGVHIKQTALGTGSRAPTAIAADPDGSIWIGQGGLNSTDDDTGIRRVRPDGIVERIAGDTGAVSATDNAIALSSLVRPAFLKVGPSGDLYVVDHHGHRVWRITNESPRRIRLVAGTGNVCYTGTCGNGGLATAADLNTPTAITFDPNGNTYIAEADSVTSGRVRRIDPKGVISTLLGSGFVIGNIEYDGTGRLLLHNTALNAHVYEWPLSAAPAVGVTPTIAYANPGCSNPQFFLDRMKRVAFNCHDQLLFATDNVNAKRFAGMPSDLSYIFGNESYGDGRNALQSAFTYASLGLVAPMPDGSIVIVDGGNKLRRVQQQPLTSAGTFLFPSENGSELYEFGDHGKHIRTRSALTGAVRFQFNYNATSGLLERIADADGNTTTIQRPNANTVQFVAPHGQVTTLNLNASTHLLTSYQNPLSQTYSFTMSGTGLLTQMTDLRGGTHTFEYDANGMLDRDTDPLGATGRQTLSSTLIDKGYKVDAKSGMGLTTTYTLTDEKDAIRGVATRRRVITTPRNASYTDDIGSDQVTVHTDADGTVTTTVQTADPRYGVHAPAIRREVKTPLNVSHFTAETVEATLATANDPLSVTSETRTKLENPAYCNSGSSCATFNSSQVVFDLATRTRTYTSRAGRVRTETLDVKDRVVSVQEPGVASIDYVYDAAGNVSSVTQGSRQTLFTYSGGELSTVTDPAGRVTSYTSRDALSRPLSITMPGSRVVSYTYDPQGADEASITPPGKAAHTQVYNSRDLFASFTPPSGAQVSMTYNPDRQLTSVDFATGADKALFYTQGLFSGVTADANVSRTFGRDAAERVTSITTGSLDNVALGFTYDGRLVKSVQWTSNVQGTLNYDYDNHFKTKKLTIATTDFYLAYDADDLLVGISGGASETIGRNAQSGRIETVTTGALLETRSYDPTYGELSSLAYTVSGNNRYTVTYVRDTLGRVTTKTETVDTLPAVVSTYTYDAAGRLDSETRAGVTTTWGYDGNGNRNYLNGVFIGNADNQDRLPATYNGTNPFAYDSATGNTLNKGNISYSWDRLGNLRGVSQPYPGPSPTYLYDGQERRVARKTGSTFTHKWLYDGQLRIVAELNASNVVQKRFVYGSRDNVPDLMITSAGTFRLVTDQLGSVRRVINVSSGASVQEMSYDAWGKALVNSPAGYQPFGFAGGLYDAGTGMLHFGAREYDPTLGRWLSRDAARWGGGLNFYVYAGDDPVNLIDPTGRYAVGGGLIVVAGGSASAGAGPTGLALAAGGGAIVWAAWKILKAIDEYKHPTVGGYSPPAPDPGGNGTGGNGGPYRTPGQPPGPQYPECGGMAQRATEKCCRDKTGHRDDDEGTCPSSPQTLQNFNDCMDENGW